MGIFGAENCVEGYAHLQRYYKQEPMANHLDLSGMNSNEPTYVDSIHYSSSMNETIAGKIADRLLLE